MTIQGWKIFAVILLLLAAAASLLLLFDGTSAVPRGPADLRTEGSVTESIESGEGIPDPVEGTAPVREQVADLDVPAPSEVLLRGRCVEASSGLPLAGCVVRLRGVPRRDDELTAYVNRNGPVVWEGPENQNTGPDGRFSFVFTPPPPYEFTVTIRSEGHVRTSTDWYEPKPGVTLDVGDIRMVRGSVVTGRLTDQHGNPLAGHHLPFRLVEPQESSATGEPYFYGGSQFSIRGGEDGTYRSNNLVAPGTWRSDNPRVVPGEFTVLEGDVTTQVDFVYSPPEATDDFITGSVEDEAGEPVRGAEVRLRGVSFQTTRTGSDGRFRFQRSVGASRDPVKLAVFAEGYEYLESERYFEWNGEEVGLVLRGGLAVDLLVVDGQTGEPVERYGVRYGTDPTGGYAESSLSLRHVGDHPGGRQRLEDMLRGPNLLIVEPADPDYLRSTVHRFTVTEQGAPLQIVPVHRAVSTTLELTYVGGGPAGEARVQLLANAGEEPVDVQTLVRDPEYLGMLEHRGTALLVFEGDTDAEGKTVLEGPPGVSLVLRVLGPGQPTVVQDIVLEGGGVLQVEVPRGAALVGRLVPQERLPDLFPESGARMQPPSIELLPPEPDRWESFPYDGYEPALVAEDGSFRITGIPPGSWDVFLRYSPGEGQGTLPELMSAGVDLREGEVHEVEFDLVGLGKGRLIGRVFVNGEVWGSRYYSVFSVPRGPSYQSQLTGSEGKFELDVVQGEYELKVWLPDPGGTGGTMLSDPGTVIVGAGQTVEHVFRLQHVNLDLRLLASDGVTPLPDLDVYLSHPDILLHRSALTDEEGRIRVPMDASGPVEVLVWPRHLSTAEAREKVAQDRAALRRISVTTLDLTPGQPGIRDVVLPASTGY